MKGKKNHYSLDRPHHGWEGISNGGEIYGESSTTSKRILNNDDKIYDKTTISKREMDYLKLVSMALKTSMEDKTDAYSRSKEIIEYAKREYSDLLEDEEKQSSEKEIPEFQESTHRKK